MVGFGSLLGEARYKYHQKDAGRERRPCVIEKRKQKTEK